MRQTLAQPHPVRQLVAIVHHGGLGVLIPKGMDQPGTDPAVGMNVDHVGLTQAIQQHLEPGGIDADVSGKVRHRDRFAVILEILPDAKIDGREQQA
ncbi:MAG: hypothetical protein U5L06_01755 [Rhodovibrio sp.]|nr:hypothetical protein [Rhodovibrio sp.]